MLHAAVCAFALAAPNAASAARVVVTGHDAESHCIRDSVSSGSPGACQWVRVGTNWVRATAPNPSRPVLVLDRGALDLKKSLDSLGIPNVQVDPRSPAFASLPLSTSTYSAIAIASSKDDPTDPTPQDLNELGSTPDTDAINARAADFAAFFAAGGGLEVFSGGAAARADSAKYYGFLRITRAGHAVAPPFALQPTGSAIGWLDNRSNPVQDMINCCETHIAFELPAPESPLKVAELDRAGRAVTLVAQANSLSELEEPVTSAAVVFAPLPGGRKTVCTPRKGFSVSLRRPKGIRFASVSVYVNGKRKKTVRSRRLGTRSRTRPFTVRLSTIRTSKVRIVATTASGRKLTYKRTFKPC